MSWTQPKTWSSEPLTSLDLNTYMRDNQNHLKDRLDNSDSRIIGLSSSYSTSSTEWVDVDSQNLSLTLNTHGGDVLLGFSGSVSNGRDSRRTNLNIAVDGADYFADDGVTSLMVAGSNDVGRSKPLCIVVLIPDLAAGSHSFVLRWKSQLNGVAAMEAVATHPQFWTKEV